MIDFRDVPAALGRVRNLAKRVASIDGPPLYDGQIPPRNRGGRGYKSIHIDSDKAMRQSAAWAACVLRADLVSTFPVDTYVDVMFDGVSTRTERPKPAIMTDPAPGYSWNDWVWATQFDLDRTGNAYGLITQANAYGLPIEIVPQPSAGTRVRRTKGQLQYNFGHGDNTWYPASQVWHERQYILAGCDVGLSPVAYAAWSHGEYFSMQEFVLDWFGNGGVPKAHFKNTAKKLEDREARSIKDKYNNTVNSGDLLVTGADWEYDMLQAETVGAEWLDGRRASNEDMARFYGVPADLIDASANTGKSDIMYANITQRNLQFLILKLGPTVTRREVNWSRGLLPRPRYCKINTDAILRMDPLQRAQFITAMVNARLMTNTEARRLDDNQPLTPEQIDEFTKIYGPPGSKTPQATPGPNMDSADSSE